MAETSFADVIPKKKCADIRGCGDFFIYLKQNPRTFCAALTFFVSMFIVLILAIAWLVGFDGAYFVAGIVGLVINLYGFCHFRTLMNLKEQVDNYSQNNQKFQKENGAIKVEVNRFSVAKNELKGTQTRISAAVARQKVSLGKFRALNKNLQATGKENLEILTDLNDMAANMDNKWRDELVKKEMKILHICFDRFDFGEADGINEEQYKQLKDTLPLQYKRRLNKLGSFKKIAGDDGVMQFEEFVELLDKFAAEKVDDDHKRNMTMTREQLDNMDFSDLENDNDDQKEDN